MVSGTTRVQFGSSCSLAEMREQLAAHNLNIVEADRHHYLESFWSAWKDIEASPVGYSRKLAEAAKKLREMEKEA